MVAVDGASAVRGRGVMPVERRLRKHVAQIDFSVASEDERRLSGGDGRTAVTAVAVDGPHG